MAGTESGATPRWMKVATGIVVPVLVAILVAALTPLGDSLREILFPTASTVRGSAMMSGAPLSRALVTLDGKTTTTTRLDGSFEFSRVSAREHTLGIVAAGANDFHTSFDVKRGSEETPLPPVDLTPAVKLAARVSIAVQPPNPFTLTFRLSYDIAAWLDGDVGKAGVLAVTYTLPAAIAPKPLTAASAGNRFCRHISGTVDVHIGESSEGTVVADVDYGAGRSVHLSTTFSGAQGGAPVPPGCT